MSEDLARLDATAQAELVRNREASPLELVDAAIERIEALQRRAQRGHPQALRRGARGGRGRSARRPVQGRSVPAQGPRRGVRRPAAPHGHAAAQGRGLPLARRHLPRAALQGRPASSRSARRTRPSSGILPTTEPTRVRRRPATPGTSPARPAARAAARRPRSPPGMVPVAHANDGGGSIRIPASRLRPGRPQADPRSASREGPLIGDVMSGLTVELVVSRSVRDTAAILDAVARAGAGRSVRRPRRPRARTPRRSAPTRASCASGC